MDFLKKAVQAASSSFSKISLNRQIDKRNSVNELIYRFKEICKILDYFSELENANSIEVDKQLHESKVREHFRVILNLLEDESDAWILSTSNNQILSSTINQTTSFNILHKTICN
jgi:hypothetical protein